MVWLSCGFFFGGDTGLPNKFKLIQICQKNNASIWEFSFSYLKNIVLQKEGSLSSTRHFFVSNNGSAILDVVKV